jgi:hypothetical protein
MGKYDLGKRIAEVTNSLSLHGTMDYISASHGSITKPIRNGQESRLIES